MKLHLPVHLRRALVALMTAPVMLAPSVYAESMSGSSYVDDSLMISLVNDEEDEENEEDDWIKWLSYGIESSASYDSSSGSSLSDMGAAKISGTHYMVDGIVLNSSKSGIDLSKSVNFYDTSKAYYLYKDADGDIMKSDALYKSLFAAYKQAGYSFDFLGDLESLLSTSTTSATYKNYSDLRTALQKDTKFINGLLDDHMTCWYQSASNSLQHWLDKYGIFSHSASSMPFGYNYDASLLDDFGGLAALEVATHFYKYWVDVGGLSIDGVSWFMKGGTYSGQKKSGGGGFFSKYYANKTAYVENDYFSFVHLASGQYYAAPVSTKKAFSDGIKSLFSTVSSGSDVTYFSSPLNLGYGHFYRVEGSGNSTFYVRNGGHAISCYGYTVGSDGYVSCLWVCDNEDSGAPKLTLMPYTLTYFNAYDAYLNNAPYVLVSGGYVQAVLDGWQVYFSNISNNDYRAVLQTLSGIYTPTALVQMHEEYTNQKNPQVWNGSKSGGMWTGSEVAYNADELPTTATGWDVYCASGASTGKTWFPTYYTDGRDVKFDDHASNKKVVLNATGKSITAGNLTIDTSSEYVFTTNNGTSLKVGALTKSGSGTTKMTGVQVSFGTGTLNGGTLALSSSSKFNGSSFTIAKNGVLLSTGKNTLTLTGKLIVNQGGVLKVDSDSSGSLTLSASSVQFASGGIFNMVLDSTNVTTPLLTLTGALTLGSGTIFQYNTDFNFTEGATYRLVDVDGFSASALSNVSISGGTLAYENGYIVFKPQANYSWSSGSGSWSPTFWQGKALKTAGKDVMFSNSGTSSNTVTVSQTVTPGSMSITDGKWSFVYSSSTPGAIDVQNGVVISGDSVVSSTMVFGGSSLQLLEKAQLTYTLSNTQTEQSLKLTSNSKLTLSGSAAASALQIKELQELTGDVVLNGADLIFDLSKSAAISGDITSSNTSSQLMLRNDSQSAISYSFTGNVNVAGGIEVGYRGDTATTTMKWKDDLSNRVTLSDLGILELSGSGDISGKIQGNGTIRVASGAELLFMATSGSPCFDNTLSLDVTGYAQIGGLQSGGITGTYASDVNVSGTLVLVQEVSWEGDPLYAPALALSNGGQYAIYVRRPTTYSAVEVAEHVLKDVYVASGTATISRYEKSAYVPYGTSVQLQKLRGYGNLNLAGSAFGSLTAFEIGDNAAASFSGNMNVIDQGVDAAGVTNCYHLTTLELGKGTYQLVGLEVRGDDASDGRAALGIDGDVTLKGLTSTSTSTYLYSGTMKKAVKTEKTVSPESLVVDEIQRLVLSVDSGKSYSFAGSVLGSLNLVKAGKGTQTFTGEFGGFTGNVGVSTGSLVINDSFTAGQLVLSAGTQLSSKGTVKAGATWMEGAQLSANALNLQRGSYSGQNTLTADSITLSGIQIAISSAQVSSPALTLNALSSNASMSISGFNVSYASSLADGEYSLLRYDSRFLNGALSWVEHDKSYYDANGGSGYYIVSNTINGRKYYTLMYHLNTSQRPSADLAWNLTYGTWKVGEGASQSAWTSSVADRNFYDGDRVTFSKSGTISISGAVAPGTILVNNTGSLIFNQGEDGEITGDTSLRKQGSGTLCMYVSNSYTGGTLIDGGTIITSDSRSLGSGVVELKSGTLSLGGNASSLSAALKVSGTGVLDSYSGSAVSLQKGMELAGGALSGEKMNVTGGMQLKSGSIANAISADSAVVSGNVTLSGTTVFSKGVTIQSGTLAATGSFQGALAMNGGTFKSTQGFNITASSGILLNSGTLQGNYTLSSGGVFDLNKSATLNGSLTLNGGSLELAKNAKLDVNGTLSISGNTYVSLDGASTSGVYTLATFDAISGNVSWLKLSDNMAVNERLAYGFAVQGSSLVLNVTSGAASLTWGGGYGIWSPGSGENWQITNSNGTTLSGQAFYNGDKVTFDSSGASGTVIVVGNLLPSEVVFKGTKTTSLSGEGSIGGSTKITKKGSGTVVLNQHNTYTGGTYIEGGLMIPGGETAFGSGSVYLSGEATLNVGLFRIMNDVYIYDGTLVAYDYGGTITVDGLAALGADTTADHIILKSGTLYEGSLKDSHLTAQSGNIETHLTGTTSVEKNGSGIAYISQVNTHSGNTTMNAGNLVVWNAQALGTGSVVLNGGTLELQNFAVANDILAKGGSINGAGAYAGELTVAGALTLKSTLNGTNAQGVVLKSGSISGGSLNNVDITANNGTISSVITGGSSLTVENGSVTLNGSNTFTGGLVQKSGTLTVNSSSALGTGSVTLGGGSLNMKGYSLGNDVRVTGSTTLNNSGAVTGTLILDGGKLSSATALSISGNVEMQSGELAAALQGSGSLVKKGSGTATLNGVAALSGGINVEDGQLKMTSAFSSDVTLTGGRLVLGTPLAMSSGQNIHFNGGLLSGALSTAAGAEIELSQSSDLLGNLTLNGGKFISNGYTLTVHGTLNLSSLTAIDTDSIGEIGDYMLIRYQSVSGSLANLTGIQSDDRVKSSFRLENGALWLNMERFSCPLTWKGGDGTWGASDDTVWILPTTVKSSDKRFHHGDSVVFSTGGEIELVSQVSPASVTVSGSQDLVFTGAYGIAGDTDIVKTGTGSLTMGCNNTYTGTLHIKQGTVNASPSDENTTNNSFGSGDILLSGGTLNMQSLSFSNTVRVDANSSFLGGGAFAGDLLVTNATLSGEAIQLRSGASATLQSAVINNDLVGNGGVTINGSTSTLAGNASYRGDTFVTGGTLISNGSMNVGNIYLSNATLNATQGLTVSDGAHLRATDNSTINGRVTVVSDGVLDIAGHSIVNGNITLSGGVVQYESGCLRLEGTLTLNGQNTLDVSHIKTAGLYTLLICDGIVGTVSQLELQYGSSVRTLAELIVTDSGLMLDIEGFSRVLSWGTNASGTWQNNGSTKWNYDSTTSTYADGDAVAFTQGGTVTIRGTVKPQDVAVSGASNLTLKGSGSIAGDEVVLRKSGSGKLVMNATNTYAGGTIISGGTVEAGGAGSFGTGDIVLNGGLLNLGAYAVTNNILVSGGSLNASAYAGIISVEGMLQLEGPTKAAGIELKLGTIAGAPISDTPIIVGDGHVFCSIEGASSLTVRGNAALNRNNTYTGGTTLESGTLTAGTAAALGSGLVTLMGGQLDMCGCAIRNTLKVDGIADVLHASSFAGKLVMNSGSLSGDALNVKEMELYSGLIENALVGGSVSAPASITKLGNSDVMLSGDCSQLHAITAINGGTLRVEENGWASDVIINAGLFAVNDMEFTSNHLQFAGGQASGNIQLSQNGRLTVGIDALLVGNLTLNGGQITYGGSALRVEGALTLSGDVQVNVSDLKAGVYEIFSCNEIVGSLEHLKLVNANSRIQYTTHAEAGSIYLEIAELGGTLSWQHGNGVWAEDMTANWLLGGSHTSFIQGDSVEFAQGGVVTISGDVRPRDISVSGSAEVVFSGNGRIIGDAALTKTGSGMLRVSTQNAYSGGTTLSAGTIRVEANHALGVGTITMNGGTLNLGSYDIDNDIVANGGTLESVAYDGNLTVQGAVTLQGSLHGGVRLLNQGSLTGGSLQNTLVESYGASLSSVISGDSSLYVYGDTTICGTNSFTGKTYLVSGELTLKNDMALGDSTLVISGGTVNAQQHDISQNVTITADTQFKNMGAFRSDYSRNFTVQGATLTGDTLNIYGGYDLILSHCIINNDLIGSKEGSIRPYVTIDGDTVLGGDCSQFEANVNVVKGDLRIADTSGWRATLSVFSGASLTVDNLEVMHRNLDLYGGQVNGNVRVSNGEYMSVVKSSRIIGDLTFDDGMLWSDLHAVLTVDGALTLGSGFRVSLVDAMPGCHELITFGSLVGGLSDYVIEYLDKNLEGHLKIEGNSLYLEISSLVPVASHQLTWAGNDGTWSSSSSNWVDLDGKAVSYTDGVAVSFGSGGNVTLAGTLKPAEVEVSGAANLVFKGSGSIAGSASVQKRGSGSLTMNASNTYTGGTTIDAGTVSAGGARSFGSGKIMLNGGTLQLSDYAVANDIDAKTASLSGTQYQGTLTVNGTLTIGSNTTAGKIILESGKLTSGSICNTTIEAHAGGINSTLAGQVEIVGYDYKLSSVLQNQGTLVMSGRFDASALALKTTDASYVSVSGSPSQDGFLKAGGYSVTLVNGGTVQNNGALVIHGHLGLTLGSNGVATAPGSVDYSTYYQKTDVTEKLSSIVAAAGDQLTTVSVSNGLLDLDCSTTAGLLFDGGQIALTGTEPLSVGSLTFEQKTTLSLTQDYALGEYLLFSVEGGSVNNALNLGLSSVYVGDKEYALSWVGSSLYLDVSERISQELIAVSDFNYWYKTTYDGYWQNEHGDNAVYQDGDHVLISNNKNVELGDKLEPGSVTIDCTKAVKLWSKYNGFNYIYGEGRLIKKGKGTLTLGSSNYYSGGTFLEAGVLKAGVEDAFGTGAITIIGGTLDLAGKSVQNDIELAGSAVVKGGKKYTGTFKMSAGGQLLKGSQLNIQESATLAGGVINGNLSGEGRVSVSGSVYLDANGAIRTNELELTNEAHFVTSSKGLNMNGKLSSISIIDDSKLRLGGKLSACSLTLSSGWLEVISEKASALTLTGDISLTKGANMLLNGKLSGYHLYMNDSFLNLTNEKAQSIALKGVATLEKDSTIMLNGKFSSSGLSMSGGSELHVSAAKPQSIAVKGDIELNGFATLKACGKLSSNNMTLTSSTVDIYGEKPQSVDVKGIVEMKSKSAISVQGKFNAGNLALSSGSALYVSGNKPQNVSIKGALTIGSASLLKLNGKLSVGSLSMMDGGMISMSGTTPTTIAVKGSLTLNSGASIYMDYDFAVGKTYNLITYKGYAQTGDLYAIFGVSNEDCMLFDTGKAITLTVMKDWNPEAPELSDETAADPSAPNTEKTPMIVSDAVSPMKPVSDAVVQANWAQMDASRAFVGAIAGRSMAVQLNQGESAVWASAIGDSSRYSSAGAHAGADTNVSGAALGIETTIGESSLLGMAMGNSWTQVTPHGFSRVKQDTTHFGLYAQTNWNSGICLDWSAAYGRSESTLQAEEWNQKHLQVNGRLSYGRAISSNTELRGFGGVQYYASDAGNIEGATTGSLQNVRAEIGVGASRSSGKWGLYGELALHQDVVRHNPVTNFDGYRTQGMNPGRCGVNVTVGAGYSISEHWSLNASYTGEFVENANIHSANFGASYKF